MWGAGALILVLGLAGGVLISRDVSRNIASLNGVIDAARGGDLAARAPVRGAGDEYDELATGLNDMLDRLEKSIGGLRHAGDAIAHDLRSPLTRLRARLEAAMIDAEAGRVDAARRAAARRWKTPTACCGTFNTVLAIARLEAAAEPPAAETFDPRRPGRRAWPNSTSRSARTRASPSMLEVAGRPARCPPAATSSPRLWPTCSTTP